MNPIDTILSIIIPVYNTEKFLLNAIKSILNNSPKNIEIIIVDDCSLGNCEQLVKENFNNNCKIKYIKHPKNLGLFQARYTGVINAKGKYIAHLDPDDWAIDNIYSEICDLVEKQDYDTVFFNCYEIDEQNNKWITPSNVIPCSETLYGKEIIEKIFQSISRNWIWHVAWNKVIKRNIMIEAYESIDKVTHLNMYEDLLLSFILFIKLYNTKSIYTYAKFGLMYLRHNDSITKKQDIKIYKKKFIDIIYITKQLDKIFTHYNLKPKYKEDLNTLICYLVDLYSPIKYKNFNFRKILYLSNIYLKYFFFIKRNKCTKFTTINKSISIIINKISNKYKYVSIFGDNKFALELKSELNKKGINVKYFIVTKSSKKYINSIKVIESSEINDYDINAICIASEGSYWKIKESLENINKDITVIHI